MKRLLLLLGIACGWVLPGTGQVSYNVAYTPQAGNPGGLNTEAEFEVLGWTPLLNGGLFTNQWSVSAGLPFYFEFFGQPVSGFQTTANGLLTFTTGQSSLPPSNNVNLPSAQLPQLSIACFWEAFTQAPPTGTNDQVQTKVFGTAPNRQFWIRWASFEWGPSSFVYVAIVLEETTHKVYLVDMYGSLTSNMITATVGLQKNNTFAVQYGNDQISLGGGGSSPGDNSYYTFTPYVIPPQDVVPTAVLSPQGESCGLGQEAVTVRLANIGQLTASNIKVRFTVDGGPVQGPETVPGSLTSNDTVSYTFAALADLSAAGQHELTVWVQATGDANASNDTIRTTVSNVLEINAFPYEQSFEAGPAGWIAGGSASSWELGIPANPHIQGAASGTQAWITDRLGAHNSYETSWVISPCFNMIAAGTGNWVSMRVWWESEAGWDGAALQATTNAGQTWTTIGSYTAADWYNSAVIGSMPGGQPHGWSGTVGAGNGSGGWVQVTHPLPAALDGHSSVRFRVVFASGGAVNYDGFAFDDFVIGRPPVVHVGPDGYYCPGDIVSAGNPGMRYLWSTGDTTQTLILSNTTGAPIIDSMLVVRVTNTLGLYRRDTLSYSMSVPVTGFASSITPAQCPGSPAGAIDLGVSGGLPPYTYQWSHGAQVQDPGALSPGQYSVIISDANLCETQAGPFTVTAPDPVQVSALVGDNPCHGDTQGSIDLQLSGGQGGYSVQWNHGPTTMGLTGLGAGTYAGTITDNAGCQTPFSVVVAEPLPLGSGQLLVQDASCVQVHDGYISLGMQGGTQPYAFAWSQGDSSEDATGLGPGIYSVVVVDANGCTWQSATYPISYGDRPPLAAFSYQVSGLQVQFHDSSLGVFSRIWDFGDGKQSTLPEPAHAYATTGAYKVSLVAQSACGADTAVQWIHLGTTTVDDVDTMEIRVWPNPARTELYFSCGLYRPLEASLWTLDGRQVVVRHYAPASSHRLALPQELSTGVYLLRIQAGETLYQRRVVVTP
ncbi:MAG: hypothetical protein OHK0039_02500 [Bacteroidia bacterium]